MIEPMNMLLVVHEGHADRFEEYATETRDYHDNGVILTLVNVRTFDVDAMGTIEVTFSDGNAVEVPYGTVKSGYDNRV